MKFQYWLLFAGSILLLDGSSLLNASIQTVPFGTEQPISGSISHLNCQKVASAVVTIYAGKEIGSGSIISPDGLVITNRHVVKEVVQSSRQKPIYVKLASGVRYTGQLVTTDAKNDLALVQLNAQGQLPTVPIARSEDIQPNERVCAIGSPFGRSGVLSEGTFTGFRENGDLRSAILLNPGNSGGPLLNAEGEMIGINKSIWRSETGANTGISFATSISIARRLIEQTRPSQSLPQPQMPSVTTPLPLEQPAADDRVLITVPQPTPAPAQKEPSPSPGRLGIIIDTKNLIVRQVEFGSPADVSGMRAGDRLVAIDGNPIAGFEQLRTLLSQQPSTARVTVRRNQQIATLQIHF